MTSDAHTGSRLLPLLAKNLNVVFVGTEPGDLSLRLGCYYADPTNAFYRHLAEAGFTPRRLTPHAYQELLQHGVGLDDVYGDPAALRTRLEAVRPRAVCFNSSEALRRLSGSEKLHRPWRGAAASRHATITDLVTWATSDSSWNASKYWPLRLADLIALRRCIE